MKNLEELEEQGLTVVVMTLNQEPCLILTMHERHLAKPEAKQVIRHLKETLGLKIKMITGDNKHSAYRVARYLGIDTKDVTYRAYPEDKRAEVERY